MCLKITVAQYAGFCSGVQRAIKMAEDSLARGDQVYALGDLVHNDQVIASLAGQGLLTCQNITDIPAGSQVVIRAHGVAPEVLDQAAQQQLAIIDATCPLVRRVQDLARNLAQDGYRVVILGDRAHPEVIGILGWAGSGSMVVAGSAEAAQLNWQEKYGLVVQTTQPLANLAAVAGVLTGKAREIRVYNTICKATRERQNAVRDLAGQVDLMLVIGGRQSANTEKLASVCREYKIAVHKIETAEELKAEWLRGIDRVGLTAGASTPGEIIKEVVDRMMEIDNQAPVGTEPDGDEQSPAATDSENIATVTMADKMAEIEANLAETMKEIRPGILLKGTVVQVRDDEVLVDIGGKSEGIIPRAEISHRDVKATEMIKVGDEIEVCVLRAENDEGNIILSKKRADQEKSWGTLEEAFTTKSMVEAEVINVVKGGLVVDIGARGFVPASQVERGYTENLDKYRGQTLRLRIIEFDRQKRNVVLSRKAVLEEEYQQQKKVTWENLTEGQVKKGSVRHLTNFGAFIDIGGVDGLLHVSEMSWSRIKHPSEVLKEGDEVEVIVQGIDREKEKVSLSLKQLIPSPWSTAASRYLAGQVIQGKVVRLVPFGVFVEIEPGIQGLIHISQLADRRVAKPEDVVNVGQVINVKVLDVDEAAQRMSLSLKEAKIAEEKNEYEAYLAGQPEASQTTVGELINGGGQAKQDE